MDRDTTYRKLHHLLAGQTKLGDLAPCGAARRTIFWHHRQRPDWRRNTIFGSRRAVAAPSQQKIPLLAAFDGNPRSPTETHSIASH
jgi:hypothetical protein